MPTTIVGGNGTGEFDNDEIELICEYLLDFPSAGDDGWSQVVNTKVGDDIVLALSRPREGFHFKEYFAKGILNGLGANAMFDLQINLKDRLSWDTYSRAIEFEVISSDERGQVELVYWCSKFPFPLSDRDYVFKRHSFYNDIRKCYFIISRAVTADKYPSYFRYTRVETMFSCMAIRNIGGSDDLEFTLLYFDDIKAPVPQFLIDYISKQALPEMIRRSRERIMLQNKP